MKNLGKLIVGTFLATTFIGVNAQTANPTQAQVPASAPKAEKKGLGGVVDILNENLRTDEDAKKTQDAKSTNKKLPQEDAINTAGSTSGANYDDEVISGLDDYKTRQEKLKKKIERLKKEREERLQQKLALEARMRQEAALMAEQKRLDEANAKNSKAKMVNGKKVTNSNQDYYDRQRQIMQGQVR